ncbi:MAG: endonuclease/exonuclease/phosphatase family protein [Anaerolineae bacterium]|nr:endonuclease/exonuclease/phosphatase family protein [Anaerolineae bacterium]
MDQLKIATINLHNRADRWRERRHLLVNQIFDAEPDLISLQELHFPIRQGQWLRNQINIRLEQAGKRPYRLLLRRKRHLIEGYYAGVGILTKLPVRYHDSLNLGHGGDVALRINVELPSHQTLDFVAVKLHPGEYEEDTRREQVLRLTGWLNGRGRVPLQIVAGDFNEVPRGLAVLRMKQGYKSAYELVYKREPLATFPTALRLVTDGQGSMETELEAKCLDYIFVSSAIRVQTISLFCDNPSAENALLFPSDHVGLLAVVRCAF